MACAGVFRNSAIAASAAACGLCNALDIVRGGNPTRLAISAKVLDLRRTRILISSGCKSGL